MDAVDQVCCVRCFSSGWMIGLLVVLLRLSVMVEFERQRHRGTFWASLICDMGKKRETCDSNTLELGIFSFQLPLLHSGFEKRENPP